MKSIGNQVFLSFRLLHTYCKNTDFKVNIFTRHFLYMLLIAGGSICLFFLSFFLDNPKGMPVAKASENFGQY
jgi:hypothetical protein